MAAKDQLDLLLSSVKEWNAWRGTHPSAKVDLEGSDLKGADLTGAELDGALLKNVDLRDADLGDANLRSADLEKARLDRANLTSSDLTVANLNDAELRDSFLDHADLRGATFHGGDLRGASLLSADLRITSFIGADLRKANLNEVDLSEADLSETNLEDASMLGVVLSKTYLRNASFNRVKLGYSQISEIALGGIRHLAEIRHAGPCGVSTSTLERTADSLARASPDRRAEVETFLRGAGIEEHYLEMFRSRIGLPIEFYSAFISYSHSDKPFARRLYNDLQGQGIRCWLDEKDMRLGDRILDVVNQAIRSTDRVLLCCSLASLTSSWVEDEIAMAFEKERKSKEDILIPLDLDGFLFDGWSSGSGARVRARLAGNFVGWKGDAELYDRELGRVVEALRPRGERDDG